MDYLRYITALRGVALPAILLIASCAKISSPSGGPKDEEPPVIIKSVPENGSVMFSSKSFTVTFDEYVILDKISDKFMVSPPMKNKPEVRLKGKSLVVSWEDEMADSTTYTFYFQDAIRDNNENNPINNYQYVFSTGPVLDSLSLTGNVFNASDLETAEDMMVMMYSNMSDTAPRKILPAYISRPDPSGGFLISNIKPGRYRLYAVKDLNGNRLYDLADETFAYCDSIVVITSEDNFGVMPDTIKHRPASATETTKPDIFTFGRHRLYAFIPESKKQYLKFTERKSSASLGFGLALPSDSAQFVLNLKEIPAESWFMQTNARRDTFMVWITDPAVYDLDLIEAHVTFPFTDSTGTIIQRTDTVNMRFVKPPVPRGGTGRKPALILNTNIASRLRPGTMPLFICSTPLGEPDTSKITLTEIVDSVQTRLSTLFERDSSDIRRIRMVTPLKPGFSYSLICRNGSFSDIYGLVTDSVNYRFSVATAEDYGSVTANLTGYEGAVIIQLVAEKDKIVSERAVTSPGTVKFGLLDKGSYRLKAIYDLDGNGAWTTGDYDLRRSPEPVTYYGGELEVKINWELEQDWDLGKMFVKDVSLRNKPDLKK
ncbi:MAG: Ig-like domain-containing domain [Bacteroidales bacterium]|nr:Ig-like domain-containing domain [Bacteroidales bacterium]